MPANPVREKRDLLYIFGLPNPSELLVRVAISGEVQVIAQGPTPLDRTVVLLQSPDGSSFQSRIYNLLEYAPIAWWRTSTTLINAVENGWLYVDVSTSVAPAQPSQPEPDCCDLSIPRPQNPLIGDVLVWNGTDWTTLNPGALGDVLTSNGPLIIPSYQPGGGGGGMAIGGSITGATAGSILFAGAAGILAQDNANLFWDDSNNRLGIGTNTPGSVVSILRTQNTVTDVNIQNASTGVAGRTNFGVSNSIHSASFGILSTGFSGTLSGTSVSADEAYFLGNGSSALVIENTSISSHTRFAIATVEKARIDTDRFRLSGIPLEVPEISTPATPGSGFGRVYAKSDNKLYFLNDLGVETDLTAGGGGGMAIGGSITGATAGSVLFAGTAGVLAQDNANLFWDDSNNRLGIGTSAPSGALHIVGGNVFQDGNINANFYYQIQNTHAGSAAATLFSAANDAGRGAFLGAYSTGVVTSGLQEAGAAILFANTLTTGLNIYTTSTTPIKMGPNSVESLRLAVAETVFNELGNNLDFRIEGDTNANLFFVDASADKIGIGTNTPAHFVDVQAGALASTKYALNVIATLPSGSAEENGVWVDVTTNSASEHRRAMRVGLVGTATDATAFFALQFRNTVPGTGTAVIGTPGAPTDNANYGILGQTLGTTTGTNVGQMTTAEGGNVNFGAISLAWKDKTNATNVGTMAIGRQTLGTVVQVGGYFGLNGSLPTFTSAALIADNADQASPIILARDNGTTVFTIADGGDSTLAPVSGHTGDALTITAGTLAVTKKAVNLTATLPASVVSQIGSQFSYTSAAGGTGSQYGLILEMTAGYTGSAGNVNTLYASASTLFTGTWNPLTGGEVLTTDTAQSAMFGVVAPASAHNGTNVGFRGQAILGSISIGTVSGVYLTNNSGASVFRQDSLNIGSVNFVTATKHASSTTEKHIGVVGQALGGDVNVAGYFGLQSAAPTFISAALVADNGSTTSPIFIARDNGTTVFSIIDGGAVEVAEIAAPATPSSGFGRLYAKSSDSLLYYKNDAGTEFLLTGGLVNTQTGTTYTLVASDHGKTVTLDNASAITLTVPSGLPVGFNCILVQLGAGQVTVTASGTTVNNRQSHTKIAGQFGETKLIAYVTDTFVLSGDTAA